MNKITILYENHVNANYKGLDPGWGFAAYIEFEGKRILFDTGWDGHKLLANMEQLSIPMDYVDAIFLSHIHWDHTGGLPHILHKMKCPIVFTPRSYSENQGHEISKFGAEVFVMEAFQELVNVIPRIFSTGSFPSNVHVNEQGLLIQNKPEEFVLIVGCSHPGLEAFYSVVEPPLKIHTLIGGVHDFQNFDYIVQKQTKECYVGHCTKYWKKLAEMSNLKYIPLQVGLEIPI